MALTENVRAWQASGEMVEVGGHEIFVHSNEPGGADGVPLVLLLHGFPSSSQDWQPMLELLTDLPTLAFDCLGFGLSAKPPHHDYTLFEQTDIAEQLVARQAGGRDVFVIAHDMGTTVANELMARDIEAKLEMRLAGVLLFNGSMVLEAASPTPAQKLLRSRFGPLAARLTNRPVFRQQFGSIFSEAHPLTDAACDDDWALICHNGGRTLGHRLISYMDERIIHAERWHGAIRDWPGKLSLAWGMLDPVATPNVLAAMRELRPAVPVAELPQLGHYPQREDPQAMAAILRDALKS